ncbi:hypothetical protein AB205_0084230, partial [Aquarana catesbeiana]
MRSEEAGSMADNRVTESLLQRLRDGESGGLDSLELALSLGVDHQQVVGAVKSLQSLGEKLPIAKIGFSKAMSNRWIRLDKSAEGGPQVHRVVDSVEDTVKEKLQLIEKGKADSVNEKDKNELKKRKLLNEVTVKTYWVTKGSGFSTSITKQETDLTPEMIASGSWKDKKFKAYNFNALGVMPECGHLHPLMKVRTQFRQIFLEMGFTEMPTNNFIESSFWNFDALFQPQQHPARDQHDTFFLQDPAMASEFPMDYLERVKKVHSEGGYGSQGYKYDWSINEARKNILRTHTTAVSARMLYKLAQQEFTPVKYFSIDRVFRNETLDATHLAEFHQIEGVVADYGLTLGDLMGVLKEFFNKLGITKLRFKPAYNPYTEPSMEVFSYHEGNVLNGTIMKSQCACMYTRQVWDHLVIYNASGKYSQCFTF